MIHVLVPVHNRATVTAGFVSALAHQDRSDWSLLLIDDGCNDDTVDRVRAVISPAQLHVLRGDGNLWWAGALQLAYEHLLASELADKDAVLIINDDTDFGRDFLSQGMRILADHPCAAVQAVGYDRITGAVDRGAIADLIRLRFRAATLEEPANCLSTRGLLMQASVFKCSGGFRPARLPHYLSDYEFTLRLRRQGTALLCDERFRATVRLELTGCQSYRRDGLERFWTEAFSNRAKYNPRQTSAFVLLTCPRWVVPLHLTRIWLRFVMAGVRAAAGNVVER